MTLLNWQPYLKHVLSSANKSSLPQRDTGAWAPKIRASIYRDCKNLHKSPRNWAMRDGWSWPVYMPLYSSCGCTIVKQPIRCSRSGRGGWDGSRHTRTSSSLAEERSGQSSVRGRRIWRGPDHYLPFNVLCSHPIETISWPCILYI